jgi:hypothetical protein
MLRVTAKYGALGAEEVYGKEMMWALEKKDWNGFGKYYVLYFDTAAHRSEYPLGNLSYTLFEHVTDHQVLEAAIKATKPSTDSRTQDAFSSDATEIDMYANLMYKAGKNQDAIEWEEKA